jgi:ketosteroid isomerase-like protein
MGLEANVAAVQELFDAVNRDGRWAAAAPLVDPDIELETDPRHPLAGVYRGADRYAGFLAEFDEPYERTDVEVERVYARGDDVVTLVNVHRRPYGSSASVDSHIGFWWKLRDGRIVREQVFGEREKALEAAAMGDGDAVEVAT